MESMLPFVGADNAIWDGIGVEMEVGDSAETRRTLYRIYLQLVMIVEDKVRFDGAEHLEQTNKDLYEQLEKLAQLVRSTG